MKTKKISYPPIIIGTSFMLVIFILLCMIVFAVLSLSSTVKDYNYSMKNATRTTAYYEANNKAEEILAQIDSILMNAPTSDIMLQDLHTIEGLEISSLEGTAEFSITYTVPIDNTKALQVILTTPSSMNKRYTITTWKQISVTEWEGQLSLPILGSN